ncbi:NAD-dependent epimerase/dehydratase family protein [Catalinimonas niigatensis]|uniref:NAD-dependent epimerase/dehydratase family protein n=1 Tax=Catalinimonas niigatensis TaxID=1397264 RepID=UPI0026660B05|nr:NAD-dependent epimerase/dehydratase family protein [Catalinimonas niigatensis]WPP50968.1 NAD-dependent epimerase/dehydratase family protein [Catalinimonas niigatensis]
MEDLAKLEEEILAPSEDLIGDMKSLEGDILILGVGGKMGPSLAALAKKALLAAGKDNAVIGVSRFSEPSLQQSLKKQSVQTIKADLLDNTQLESLPEVKNVIFMAGTKFGTTGKESFTWAMNAYLPGRVAEKFKKSKIVSFSTGNVYPFVPVYSGGATEDTTPEPLGEYAQSCLGRERMFEHFSKQYQIPTLIYRLNYAVDFKYGVLLEVAKAVLEGREIDLSTGHVNVIWQGDANEYALRSLKFCDTPPRILNITGPETLSIRWAAREFGKIFNKTPHFVNEEQPTALLNNASTAHQLFGYPKVSLKTMMEIVATWLTNGGETINKPTHFQERKGAF